MSLTNAQYQEIMRMYEARRLSNYNLSRERRREVYAQIPEMRDLDREMTHNSILLGKQLVTSEDQQSTELCRQKNQKLAEQKRRLLLDHGFSQDYLDPVYTCPDCKDTGYIGTKKCRCFRQAVTRLIYSDSNMEHILEKENFNHFNDQYYSDQPLDGGRPSPRQNIHAVVKKCREFIQHFPSSENLLLHGSTGTGKTFLSHCIAKEIMDQGFTCVYVTAFQLFDILTSQAYQKRKDELPMSYQLIFQCDLLVIDDLGTELNNAFITSQLFHCLNERQLKEKSTLISTNLSVRSLKERYTERIVSRIIENYTICQLYGEDIRLKKSFSRKP
ncbi:ATP-binding protein [Anaerostipes sp.]|uniref:ATP-binding protein n=1 Tax=Anaerostipes sp. TaxID=1872530 RepID=UPI0025B92EB3|nr:ATP-binding protein [Anaerostipes sp.]MBS7009515.1 ATP-binding protein [Anaerostipes sp.]